MPKCIQCEEDYENEEGRVNGDGGFVCADCDVEDGEAEGTACPKCHEMSHEYEVAGTCPNCGYGSG